MAVDDTTIDYVKGRPFTPAADLWDQAVAYWRTLHSDADAQFDTVVELDATQIKPQVTWGTSPEMVLCRSKTKVPNPPTKQRPGQAFGSGACAAVHGARCQ